MTEIDWLKDAPIWQGNVVVSRGDKRSISSLNKPFSMAIDAIAKELNITLDPQETLIRTIKRSIQRIDLFYLTYKNYY